MGHPARALAHSRSAVELAKTLGQPYNVAYALASLVVTHWMCGDIGDQKAAAGELVAVSEEQGFDLFTGAGHIYRGAAARDADRDPDAMSEVLEGAMVAARTGMRGAAPAMMSVLAEAQRRSACMRGQRPPRRKRRWRSSTRRSSGRGMRGCWR